jgi:hypothetical protein
MKPDVRAMIADLDAGAQAVGLPTYSHLVDLLIKAQPLIEHRGRARVAWVKESAEAVAKIHSNNPKKP